MENQQQVFENYVKSVIAAKIKRPELFFTGDYKNLLEYFGKNESQVFNLLEKGFLYNKVVTENEKLKKTWQESKKEFEDYEKKRNEEEQNQKLELFDEFEQKQFTYEAMILKKEKEIQSQAETILFLAKCLKEKNEKAEETQESEDEGIIRKKRKRNVQEEFDRPKKIQRGQAFIEEEEEKEKEEKKVFKQED
ncbi:MAG: hypothetical protein AABY22_17090 [Nanoarchaeota archaeon]